MIYPYSSNHYPNQELIKFREYLEIHGSYLLRIPLERTSGAAGATMRITRGWLLYVVVAEDAETEGVRRAGASVRERGVWRLSASRSRRRHSLLAITVLPHRSASALATDTDFVSWVSDFTLLFTNYIIMCVMYPSKLIT